METYTIYSIVTFITAILAYICTALLIKLIGFRRFFEKPFYLIAFSQIIANLCITTSYLGPISIQLQWPEILHDEIEEAAGFIILVGQFSGLYSSLLMTINRFVAVAFPLQCSTWFSVEWTRRYILIAWIVSLIEWTALFINSCEYKLMDLHLHYDETICGAILETVLDAGQNCVLVAFFVCVDIVTFYKLRKQRKAKNFVGHRSSADEKREYLFFLQAVLSNCIYISLLIVNFIGSHFVTNKHILFWLTTFTLEFYAIAIIIAYFVIYKNLRKSFWKLVKTGNVETSTVIFVSSSFNKANNKY